VNPEVRWIAVGRVSRAHGVKGEVTVLSLSDVTARFEPGSTVFVGESNAAPLTVETRRGTPQRPLIKFREIATPEEIASLQEWTIEIPESAARTRQTDEYFLHDLIGLRLVDAAGKERGEVIEAYEGGGGVLLNVKRADDHEYEVPFAAAICTEIDIDGKRILVDLPEGIDED